ncbi:MAG: methyltransferase domain-containing protein [Nanoarchaeota archaeon]
MRAKDDLWYRKRGLSQMEERFGVDLRTQIKERIKKKKKVRIIELGFGEGKCLLELQAAFPTIELHGINNVRKGHMHKESDFINNAKLFGIPIYNVPHAHFYDAGEGLAFPNNYFDMAISQVSIHYVKDKAKLIEEIWRVLKPSGRAFLHLDTAPEPHAPDFIRSHPETPRFIIYRKGRFIKVSTYLKRIKGISFKKSPHNSDQRILLMKKSNKKLNLDLVLDSTLNLTRMKGSNPSKTDAAIWWGIRSIYTVS